MRQVIFVALIISVIASCSKDKFNTKPTLKFKDINSKKIFRNDNLIFDLNVTDLEGDLTDTLFVMKRVRNCTNGNTNTKYKLPIFPTKANLDINLNIAFTYGSGGPYQGIGGPVCVGRNDSCIFRFVIKDKAGNLSDTVNSPELVIHQ